MGAWTFVGQTFHGSTAPPMRTTLQPRETVPSVSEALAFWAAETPEAIALLAPGREPCRPYRELHAAVERLAGALRAYGVSRQDGLALLLPEGPELCLLLLASSTAGIAVPLAWPHPEVAHARILAHPRVRAVVVCAETASSLPTLLERRLPVLIASLGSSGRLGELRLEGEAWAEAVAPTSPAAEDLAVILHSSGTTGRPKLVPRTHRNLIATRQIHVEVRGSPRPDRGLSLSRTTYSLGLSVLIASLFSGSSLISVPELNLAALPSLAGILAADLDFDDPGSIAAHWTEF